MYLTTFNKKDRQIILSYIFCSNNEFDGVIICNIDVIIDYINSFKVELNNKFPKFDHRYVNLFYVCEGIKDVHAGMPFKLNTTKLMLLIKKGFTHKELKVLKIYKSQYYELFNEIHSKLHIQGDLDKKLDLLLDQDIKLLLNFNRTKLCDVTFKFSS